MGENDDLNDVKGLGVDGVLEMLWVSCTGPVGIQSDCSCQIEYHIFTISTSHDLDNLHFEQKQAPTAEHSNINHLRR
jgi:hypothetical protein